MIRKIFEKQISNYKKGTYIRMEWQSVNGEYLKVSNGLVRLFTKEVITCKNGSEIVRMRLTKNKHHKVKVAYYHNGVEISESDYYNGGNTKSNVNDWFVKRIEDIIKVGC